MPLFTRESDQQAERRAVERLQTLWRCRMYHRGMTAEVDFACYRDSRLVGFVEFKRRRVPRSAYATVFLSERKYRALLELRARYRQPAYYVVGFDDGLGLIEVGDRRVVNAAKALAGRPPRPGSAHDKELCRLIPLDALTWL